VRLLVSVASPEEALEALEGGADIIDAKNPSAGSLGAVTIDVLRAIFTAVHDTRPLSAALGDAGEEESVASTAAAFAAAGAEFVKIGFAGTTDLERATSLTRAAVRAIQSHPPAPGRARRCEVVVVAYADADRSTTLSPAFLVDVAARAAASGVLLDTFDKNGPGLRALISPEALAAWIAVAHGRQLFTAVAGKLSADDLGAMRAAGADIAGVRGAACVGGRTGRISRESVRALRAQCLSPLAAPLTF
jgi:uncharacterized protein (UPF0264 family)